MVLPSGVTRLAGSDTADLTGLRGTVSVLQLRGPAGRPDHQAWVWRPPGADSATTPVLYFLPGDPGSARDPFTAGLARALNRLLRQGYPPFVFASVDSADGTDRVTGAAIPAVEGTHMRDAAHRAVAGFAAGGDGAMNIAMRNPGVFGQVVSIAGNIPSAAPCQARGLRVLLDEDASEPDPLVRGQAARVGGLLRACGVPVTVRVQPGAHDWAYAMGALRQSFTFLAGNWRQAAADGA